LPDSVSTSAEDCRWHAEEADKLTNAQIAEIKEKGGEGISGNCQTKGFC